MSQPPDRRPQTGDVQVLSLNGFFGAHGIGPPPHVGLLRGTLNRHEQVRIRTPHAGVSARHSFRELLAGCVEQASLSHAQLVVARSDTDRGNRNRTLSKEL